MKWSYILFLPAIVSAAWALFIVMKHRRPARSQVILSLMLLIESVAMTVFGVFFRGQEEQIFIYTYTFEVMAVVCGPMFYIGICSHTEARGATLKQKRVFVIPLLFIIGLTIATFWLGPRRYGVMCVDYREYGLAWGKEDPAWTFMLIWKYGVFPTVLIVYSFILVIIATLKIRRFQHRYNSYYAKDMNLPYFNMREFNIIVCIFLPLAGLIYYAAYMRPPYYKYWLIVGVVLLAVVQYITGRLAYRMKYDARYLAEYIRTKNLES